MKTNSSKFNNLQTLDKSLSKVQKKMIKVAKAREENINALDDDMKETWANFRTEVEKLQKELSKVISCILIEDGEA